MMRPRKMKRIELSVLERDVNAVIEYLGRRALMHFSEGDAALPGEETSEGAARKKIEEILEKIKTAAVYLGLELPGEPLESSVLPGLEEERLAGLFTEKAASLSGREHETSREKEKVEEAFTEARAFENLNAPFSDLDQLSYLTLRVGRLDPKERAGMQEALSGRAVIVPLGGEDSDRFLLASSRKGRFALDSELKKHSFAPIAIPEGYQGVPKELLAGLEERLTALEADLAAIEEEKARLRDEAGPILSGLAASYLMASQVEELKGRLQATKSVYFLSGWVSAGDVKKFASDMEGLTGGTLAIRSFDPGEVQEVLEKKEKVPVSLEHGAFVKSFEKLVFSYGAPLYGTIDPTPFVAFSFALLFGVMFGDLGQGLVLFLLGLILGKAKTASLQGFKVYASPMVAVGVTSMVMGFLNGEFFTSESLLIGPTRAIASFFMNLTGQTGEAPERFLHLMPEKGNLARLFYFFGFTVGLGVLFNSIGLWVNIINQMILKNYERALFAKTGLAGICLFWYALFIAVKMALGGKFFSLDLVFLLLPAAVIFFGPVIWRVISGQRPILEHGLIVFVVEGFVEMLETASTYISSTMSFLRVGAFALSHAVLSFIIFTLCGMVRDMPVGAALSLVIMIFGNMVIIFLEGMIVAIQVVRLQYYEFFSKFFTETGVEFAPFRFRKGAAE